jgi:hypothetical protein
LQTPVDGWTVLKEVASCIFNPPISLSVAEVVIAKGKLSSFIQTPDLVTESVLNVPDIKTTEPIFL